MQPIFALTTLYCALTYASSFSLQYLGNFSQHPSWIIISPNGTAFFQSLLPVFLSRNVHVVFLQYQTEQTTLCTDCTVDL